MNILKTLLFSLSCILPFTSANSLEISRAYSAPSLTISNALNISGTTTLNYATVSMEGDIIIEKNTQVMMVVEEFIYKTGSIIVNCNSYTHLNINTINPENFSQLINAISSTNQTQPKISTYSEQGGRYISIQAGDCTS